MRSWSFSLNSPCADCDDVGCTRNSEALNVMNNCAPGGGKQHRVAQLEPRPGAGPDPSPLGGLGGRFSECERTSLSQVNLTARRDALINCADQGHYALRAACEDFGPAVPFVVPARLRYAVDPPRPQGLQGFQVQPVQVKPIQVKPVQLQPVQVQPKALPHGVPGSGKK